MRILSFLLLLLVFKIIHVVDLSIFGLVKKEDRKKAIVEHILGMKETLVLLRCLIQIGGANIYKGMHLPLIERIRASGLQGISLSSTWDE